MKSYENITQASRPYGWSQSVTYEKENTKQSNANSLSKCVVSIGKVRTLIMSSKKQ